MVTTATIWAYSDPVLMQTALIGVKAIMTSVAYKSLVTLFFLIALVAAFFPAIFNLSSITKYYVSIFAVVAIMSLPTMDVTIVPTDDPVTGAVTVAAAPLMVALPASIFSSTGKWLSEKYEQVSFVLLGLSQDLRVFGANGGMVGGSLRALLRSTHMAPPPHIAADQARAYSKCLIPSAILWGTTFPTASVKNACQVALGALPGQSFTALDCLSRIDPLYALNTMVDPMPISTSAGTATTCDVFSKQIVTDSTTWAKNYFNAGMDSGSASLSRNYKAVMSQLKQICPGGVCGALKPELIIAGQSSSLLLTQALASSPSSKLSSTMTTMTAKVGAGNIIGETLLNYVPLALDGILAFMALLFPLVVVVTVFSAAQGSTVSMLGNYYVGFLAMSLVPAVMSVINSFMTYFMVYKSDMAAHLAGQLHGEVTSVAAVQLISSMASAPASAMGYMLAAAPVITWGIVSSGSVQAGQMLGNMMQGGNQTAEANALGNFNVENVNAGGKSFAANDNSSQFTSAVSSQGGVEAWKDVKQSSAGAKLAEEKATADSVKNSTGTDLKSFSSAMNAGKTIGRSKTAALSSAIGAANLLASTAAKEHMTLPQAAEKLGMSKQYVEGLKALREAKGTKQAVAENPGTFGGADPHNFWDIGSKTSNQGEVSAESAQAKANAMDAIFKKTGMTVAQREFFNTMTGELTKLGDSQGEVDGAAKAGTSVQGLHKAVKSIGQQTAAGNVQAVHQIQQSTGQSAVQQGFYQSMAQAGRSMFQGPGFEQALSYMESIGLSGESLMNAMGAGTATEHAKTIGLANNMAKLLGFKGGLRSMSKGDIQTMIGAIAQSSLPEAMKGVAAAIHGGQLLESTTPEQKQQMTDNLASVDSMKLLRDSTFGGRLSQQFTDGKGGLDWGKLNAGMKSASLSDTFSLMEQVHSGEIYGTEAQTDALSKFAAQKGTSEVRSAQKQFGSASNYGKTMMTEAQGKMAHVQNAIQASGGAAAFVTAQGFEGTTKGAEAFSAAAAISALNTDEQNLLKLGSMDDVKSYASNHNISPEQVIQDRSKAETKMNAYASEWGHKLGVTQYGHGFLSNLSGQVSSMVGDGGNVFNAAMGGLGGLVDLVKGGSGTPHGESSTMDYATPHAALNKNEQGHSDVGGTSFLEQLAAVPIVVAGGALIKGGVKVIPKLFAGGEEGAEAAKSIQSFIGRAFSSGKSKGVQAERVEPTIAGKGAKAERAESSGNGGETVGNQANPVSSTMRDQVSSSKRVTGGKL